MLNSNTTFVKVKFDFSNFKSLQTIYSNTTFVKVKSFFCACIKFFRLVIQIQHLLKLN